MELKTRQEKRGVKEVDYVQMQKVLLLKVESKLVIRFRTLSFTNQGYSRDPIGVKKCSPLKQYLLGNGKMEVIVI